MTTYTYSDELVSDLHKDVFGYRPSAHWMQMWTSWQPNQKQTTWDDLCAQLDKELAWEEKRKAEAVAALESRVDALIDLGAADWDMAIRWIMQAHDIDPTKAGMAYAREELEYTLGLPYGFFARRAG